MGDVRDICSGAGRGMSGAAAATRPARGSSCNDKLLIDNLLFDFIFDD